MQPEDTQNAHVSAQSDTSISLFGAVQRGSCDACPYGKGRRREASPQPGQPKAFAQGLQLAGSSGKQHGNSSRHIV
jgi:hypothetical protein